jgi:hypothetical protein
MGLRKTIEELAAGMRKLPIIDSPRFYQVFAWKHGRILSPSALKFLDFVKNAGYYCQS